MVSTVDMISLIFLSLAALVFILLAFFFRGQWWWSLLSGLLWILLGINSIITPVIFAFERELAVVWIVIGIGVFFMPAWYKKKEQKTGAEVLEESDNFNEMDRDLAMTDSEAGGYRGRTRKK